MTLSPAALPAAHAAGASPLADHFAAVRDRSVQLIEGLSPEDCIGQSMPGASPAKWHLAHTTWFFEQFVLGPHVDGYEPFDPQFSYLYNSYYNAVGDRVSQADRGLMTRPGLDRVLAFRRAVDRRVADLLDRDHDQADRIAELINIGIHHEQQHQELLLTDIKHLLSRSPLAPAYRETPSEPASAGGPEADALRWIDYPDEQVREIGHNADARDAPGAGFAFDNESPRHRTLLHPFQIADRLVTHRDWVAFMDDGGYERAELWLDAGWAAVRDEGWRHPLYWVRDDGGDWQVFTLGGVQPLRPDEPVCHVSFFEADAYARWADARLPTEAEWEVAATDHAGPIAGNLLEADTLHPVPRSAERASARGTSTSAPGTSTRTPRLHQAYGDVWEWTADQYRPYPGYRPVPGALGEYNGKFMCNQFVLRGGSFATPGSHLRTTYRNFWAPATRWQFAGLRLARDL